MTMVNALQIFIDAYPLLNISVPANVVLILNEFASISSFNILPANYFFSLMFSFSESSVVGIGFASMGVSSARLILNMNSFFFYYLLFGITILFYFLLLLNKNANPAIQRLIKKLEKSFIWNGCVRLVTQSYLSLCIGCLLSFLDTRFETKSDIVDFVVTLFMAFVVVAFPFWVYCIVD